MNLKNTCKSVIGKVLMNWTYAVMAKGSDNGFRQFLKKIHVRLLSWMGLSCFPVESNDSYKTKFNALNVKILEEQRKGVVAEVVYLEDNKPSTLKERKLHDLRQLEYKQVLVTGDSDVVVDLKNECVICDVCYNIEDNLSFIDGLLYRHKRNLCLLRNNFKNKPDTIPSGIMLVGKFSMNYFHVFYENLNRLLVLKNTDIAPDVPLLVDEPVFNIPSMTSVFTYLSENLNRPVLRLKKNQSCFCESLYAVDHVNYMVPHIKRPMETGDLYIYDARYLKMQKEQLLKHRVAVDASPYLFVSRKRTQHRHFNEDEVYALLKEFGFQLVYPEQYSFEEQMSLFHNAECIVGGTGAAFTNLLFCKDGCKVLCISSIIEGREIPVFNTIAVTQGVKFYYYKPDKTASKRSVHADYYIDIQRFRKLVQQFVGKEE